MTRKVIIGIDWLKEDCVLVVEAILNPKPDIIKKYIKGDKFIKYNVKDGTKIELINLSRPSFFFVSPDKEKIFIDGNIYLLIDNFPLLQKTNIKTNWVNWSPDSKKIAYAANHYRKQVIPWDPPPFETDQIHIFDIETGITETLTNDMMQCNKPVWSK